MNDDILGELFGAPRKCQTCSFNTQLVQELQKKLAAASRELEETRARLIRKGQYVADLAYNKGVQVSALATNGDVHNLMKSPRHSEEFKK
jgi:hypothetical protein